MIKHDRSSLDSYTWIIESLSISIISIYIYTIIYIYTLYESNNLCDTTDITNKIYDLSWVLSLMNCLLLLKNRRKKWLTSARLWSARLAQDQQGTGTAISGSLGSALAKKGCLDFSDEVSVTRMDGCWMPWESDIDIYIYSYIIYIYIIYIYIYDHSRKRKLT